MIIKNLILCLLISILTCSLSATNLIPNPGFEDDTAGNIDYWRERDATAVGADTSTYTEGSQSAKFDSTAATTSYYYANYNLGGTTANLPATESDAMYEFSIKYKTEASAGIYLQMCFYKGTESLGMYETTLSSSTTWATLKVKGMARKGADKVQAGIYYKSTSSTNDRAWVDDALLVEKIQLCRNGSAEIDAVSPIDITDYWHPRGGTYTQYHHVETDVDNTYLGNNAMLFDSPSTSNQAYLYGPYDAAGTNWQLIPVCPGDSYTISCFSREDSTYSGLGAFMAIMFYNGESYVTRSVSSRTNSAEWIKMTHAAVIPSGVDGILYSLEYDGQNEIWFDEVKVVQKNLVTNSSFETDAVSPTDKPDYWSPRGGTTNQYHHVDTTAYEGSSSVQFDNTTATNEQGYFYGPATTDGTRTDIDVLPGEIYTFSAYGKVDTDFSGPGIKVSILFYNDSTYVSRVDSSTTTPSSWTQKTVTATVPATGVNKLRYSVEFYGQNSAWFDRAYLSKTSPWYYSEVSIDSFESLTFTPPAKQSYSDMLNAFMDYHDYYELHYMEWEVSGAGVEGTWGLGLSGGSDRRPLVTNSANAVMAYLHAYDNITDSAYDADKVIFKARATAGLDWLLTQQIVDTNSDYYGAFPYFATTTPTFGGSEMYDTGIAVLALLKGYTFFENIQTGSGDDYLDAANLACDYLVNMDGSTNANFNAYGAMALAANYAITGTTAYLDRAVYLSDTNLSFQLDSGMWSDDHNQAIYYHGIITRSLVHVLNALPASHPKKGVIEHGLYKAINHIRQSQNEVASPTSGALVRHPLSAPTSSYECPHSTQAISEAYELLGWTSSSITDSLNTLSVPVKNDLDHDITLGHHFVATALLFDYYYNP